MSDLEKAAREAREALKGFLEIADMDEYHNAGFSRRGQRVLAAEAALTALDAALSRRGGVVEGKGASLAGPGQSATPEPVPVSALTGDCPSRAADLWCVHMIGPDEVIAARSLRQAVAMACEANKFIEGTNEVESAADWVLCYANVARWPHSPEAHAEDLARQKERPAQAIEARRAETGTGSVEDKRAVPRERDAPEDNPNPDIADYPGPSLYST